MRGNFDGRWRRRQNDHGAFDKWSLRRHVYFRSGACALHTQMLTSHSTQEEEKSTQKLDQRDRSD